MSRRGTKTDETGVYLRDDDRYLVVATAKDPETGTQRQKQKTLEEGKTLQDAVQVRKSLKEEIRTPETPQRAIRSVADYTEQWIARKAKRVKPKTARTYADALEDRVLAVSVRTSEGRKMIGNIPLDDFERNHVIQWMEHVESLEVDDEGTPYATSTLRKWWRVFRSVIKDMAASGEIPRDYSQRMDPPETGRRRVREEPALSLDEMHAIAEAAEEYTPKRHAEISTLVYTGMRTGELWALRWPDLDRDDGVIHIRRSVSKGTVTDATKSHRDRVVPLFEPPAEAIDQHRRRMMRDEHPGLTETELIFPSDNAKPRIPGSLRAAFSRIADELGLERTPTPQLIRKSVVTVLRDQGVPAMAAKALVGHSDDRIQEHYYSANEETRALARVLVGGDSS